MLAFFLFFTPAHATLDVIEPTALCDRFLGEKEKQDCEQYMQKKKPDTYVSSVCQNAFDDKAFYQCIDLAAQFALDPKKIETCDEDGISDDSRLQCLRKLAKGSRTSFQRLPASIPRKSSTHRGAPSPTR